MAPYAVNYAAGRFFSSSLARWSYSPLATRSFGLPAGFSFFFRGQSRDALLAVRT